MRCKKSVTPHSSRLTPHPSLCFSLQPLDSMRNYQSGLISMLHSMTAFARQQRQVEEGILCWEVRSLNHRYLEVTLHLPEDLRALEVAVREKIAAAVKRGQLDCQLRLRMGPGVAGVAAPLHTRAARQTRTTETDDDRKAGTQA